MASVPRISDMTGKKSAEQLRAEREWIEADKRRRALNQTIGKPQTLNAWKYRVSRTRSL